jgi:cardiolipin synthase
MLRDANLWLHVYYLSEWVIRLGALLVIPSRRSPATAKNWLFVIFFLPWPGLVLFWFLGGVRLSRRRQALLGRLYDVISESRQRLEKHPSIFHPELGPELDGAVALAENLGHLPIMGGNAVELISDYQGFIDRLVADIDAAAHHAHLQFYIFADDDTSKQVIDALGRAVVRGVKCRVLVDSLGSRYVLGTLLPKLESAGVAVAEMLPVGWFRFKTRRFDLRNHRKIAVIDGRVGYAGSQNIVDPAYKPDIIYEELMVRVTGPVVLELQFVFVSDWFLEMEENLDSPEVFPAPDVTGQTPAQVLPSGPGYQTENHQRLFVSLIHSARRRVVITTPYFIPDAPLLQALETAVLRGVDVHLIVSQKADQVLVSLAQKSYYTELLNVGASVHLYYKNFLHAKHMSVDDSVVLIGSSNMDIRSFSLNAEVLLICYDPAVAADLHALEEGYMEGSALLDEGSWSCRPLYVKTFQRLARLFSPLL